jgi:putative transposase
MSKTIPPSEQVRQQLRAFLREALQTSAQPSSELLRLAAQVVVQEIVEEEVTDYLGRERYERRAEDERGYRNGYEPGRIRSAEGEIEVRVPQVRDSERPYRSTLMEFLRGNSDVLEIWSCRCMRGAYPRAILKKRCVIRPPVRRC